MKCIRRTLVVSPRGCRLGRYQKLVVPLLQPGEISRDPGMGPLHGPRSFFARTRIRRADIEGHGDIHS